MEVAHVHGPEAAGVEPLEESGVRTELRKRTAARSTALGTRTETDRPRSIAPNIEPMHTCGREGAVLKACAP